MGMAALMPPHRCHPGVLGQGLSVRGSPRSRGRAVGPELLAREVLWTGDGAHLELVGNMRLFPRAVSGLWFSCWFQGRVGKVRRGEMLWCPRSLATGLQCPRSCGRPRHQEHPPSCCGDTGAAALLGPLWGSLLLRGAQGEAGEDVVLDKLCLGFPHSLQHSPQTIPHGHSPEDGRRAWTSVDGP